MEIHGFPDYLIYPDGRVWSKKRNIFLKECERKNNYSNVKIYNGKQKTFMIHRLVAEHYIPNPENKPEVDHINRNKHDNRVENLRWVSSKENCKNRNPKRVQKNNKLGHKNISFTNNKTYKFLIQRKGVYVNKTFKTLTDALCYKFYFLLSHRKYFFG